MEVYVATLCLNGAVEAGTDVLINVGATKSVSFTLEPPDSSYEVRVDRLLGGLGVGKPAPIPEKPAPAPIPEPEPTPTN